MVTGPGYAVNQPGCEKPCGTYGKHQEVPVAQQQAPESDHTFLPVPSVTDHEGLLVALKRDC